MILELDTGNTAWILTSAALVLLMTPGLALFYGGMVRAKGVLNMMMMSFITMGTIGVLWILFGYSMAFGDAVVGFDSGVALRDGGTTWVGLLGNPAVTQITSDNPIYVPEDNWSISLAYKFGGSGERGSITPRLDYYGQSKICFQIRTNVSVQNIDTTEEQGCAQPYELLSARIEWASPEDTWRVALGATNLTDEEYFLNKFDLTAFGQPTLEGQPGAPREWYIQFTRNFN